MKAFIGAASDLRGYQLALEVTGGTSGTLTLESLSIDINDDDYVFDDPPSTVHIAEDEISGRLAAGLQSGGMSVEPDKYLGTFKLRASNDADGTFTIDLRPADTFLRNSNIQPIPWQSAGEIHATAECKGYCPLP